LPFSGRLAETVYGGFLRGFEEWLFFTKAGKRTGIMSLTNKFREHRSILATLGAPPSRRRVDGKCSAAKHAGGTPALPGSLTLSICFFGKPFALHQALLGLSKA
jgi:hypothetical protein